MALKTSAAGRKAITRHEGVRLTAYPDPGTGGVPWTIGVGHTSRAGPPKVVKGMRITAAEADAILSRDLATFEKAVNAAVKVPLNQNEFDALVSLAFNIGSGALKRSSVIKRLNAGDRDGAADAFLMWNKAGGQVLKGLANRREDERKLFLTSTGAPKLIPAAKPTPAPSVAPDPAVDPQQAILKLGARGQYVEDLQKNLAKLGYSLRADGVFGEKTEAAVKLFQKMNGLKMDGIAGNRTQNAIGKALEAREVKPKIEAAKQAVEPAAKGMGANEVGAGVLAVAPVVTAARQVAEDVSEGVTSLAAMGPWIVAAAAGLGLGGYIFINERRKRKVARKAMETLA